METLLTIHGLLRWPVLLILAAGLARALVALGRPAPEKVEGMDRLLSSSLVAALDVQVVLGLILLFVNDAWADHRLHVGLMSSALLLGHVLSVLNRKRPGRVLFLALFLVPAALVLWGLRTV